MPYLGKSRYPGCSHWIDAPSGPEGGTSSRLLYDSYALILPEEVHAEKSVMVMDVYKESSFTGSSVGLGRAVTEHVLSQGDIVVATLRKPEAISDLASKYDSSRLLILKLDVSKLEDIKAVFAKINETYGRLDVVHNNAGYGVFAEAESIPDNAARTMFEVNFWGVVNISKEAIRFFREVNKPGVGGRLLNTSSIAGITGLPSLSLYSASKYGEYSRSFREINITILTLGGFKTNGLQSLASFPSLPAYEGGVVSQMRQAFSDPMQGGEPAKAAREIYRIANEPSARGRVLLGRDVIAIASSQIKLLQEDADASETFSADLN
ncbi:hypothetical protein M422DRAFT_257887 [Sphaerobolus stellatus SS14]|uniref:NAD(P)-binding protein n=1 Tax=Sphaerobolus stellatus (strain SS14) TaxID=990650 RepID=A0A0C9VNF8_SPHS4|nr:hypothetical protein M422DRAFT_257887 [Sphaerobolus stellatus SS14]